jgi:hypothetical protein
MGQQQDQRAVLLSEIFEIREGKDTKVLAAAEEAIEDWCFTIIGDGVELNFEAANEVVKKSWIDSFWFIKDGRTTQKAISDSSERRDEEETEDSEDKFSARGPAQRGRRAVDVEGGEEEGDEEVEEGQELIFTVAVSNLPKPGFLKKVNSAVIVQRGEPGGPYKTIEQSEIVKSNQNPRYAPRFAVKYNPRLDRDEHLRFIVADSKCSLCFSLLILPLLSPACTPDPTRTPCR